MYTDLLKTYTLDRHSHGDTIARILSAALVAVAPEITIKKHIRRAGSILTVSGHDYDLESYRRVFLIGAGKAGQPMAVAVSDLLKDYLIRGVVIVKEGHTNFQSLENRRAIRGITIYEAGHPVPDERGVHATQQIINILSDTQCDDLIICLISGGGSALMLSPVPGVSLGDLQGLTSQLLACGANINEINSLRKHLDRVKGGGLAQMAAPAQVVTLILSDVVNDPLDVIASGPTVPDTTTFSDAYQILERYKIMDDIPDSIIHYLKRGKRGEIEETPKPGDPIFEQVQNAIIGSNILAAKAARHQAVGEGLNTLLLTTSLQGEARQIGPIMAAIGRQITKTGDPVQRPACIICGGETTVTLRGKGKGGRNQELALSAVADLAGLSNVFLVTLATDGGDGPTDAAGAVVTGETLSRARSLGLDPFDFLGRNDAYNLFDPLADLLKPGPTMTNVNDLTFLFVF
jgi:hydroxypyruvate reductase